MTVQYYDLYILKHILQPQIRGKKVNLADLLSGWNLAVVNSISSSCHIVSGHFIEEENINRSVDAGIYTAAVSLTKITLSLAPYN